MNPVSFKEENVVFAADQPEYIPLPARQTDDGMVTSCWRLSFFERVTVLFTGRLWISQLSFNQPLQPQRAQTRKPF